MRSSFALFSKIGYDNTNISAIAKDAGVSVGTVYSYFADKKAIFIEAFEDYFKGYADPMMDSEKAPTQLDDIVEAWINSFIDMYSNSMVILAEFMSVSIKDQEIAQHFYKYDEEYYRYFAKVLADNGLDSENLMEKVHTCYMLIDALCQERFLAKHSYIDFDILRMIVRDTVIKLLST